MIANKLNNLHKRGFSEFDLLPFKKWTENFRLSSVLEKKDEDRKQWMFNLVMSDPTSEIFFTQKQRHQVAGEKSRVNNELEFKILILGTKQTLEQVESYIPLIKRKHFLLSVHWHSMQTLLIMA